MIITNKKYTKEWAKMDASEKYPTNQIISVGLLRAKTFVTSKIIRFVFPALHLSRLLDILVN